MNSGWPPGKVRGLMRILFAFVLVWFCAPSVNATEAKKFVPPLRVGKLEYLKLQDWAESNRLDFAYAKKNEEVKLTNRWTRLAFRLNSLRVEVNGVNLFLAYPLALSQGAVWIARKDIDGSLKPVLFPAKSASKTLVKTVAIGAGHGGKDSGYTIGAEQEKNYTLLLAEELQELIARAGLKPVMIRTSDRLIELEERPKLAKRSKADIYIELHYNCAGPGDDETRGVEVYCLTPVGANSTNGGGDSYPGPLPGNRNDARNLLLAYHVQRALVAETGFPDRGVRRARFVVLREAAMPALLIEAGFMSQPQEFRKIQDPAHRRRTAQAILDGLLAYKRLIER